MTTTKATRPNLTDAYPFILPGHLVAGPSLEKRLAPRKNDIVARVTKGIIYRLPAAPIKTRRATPPTFAEQLQTCASRPQFADADANALANSGAAALDRLADKARNGDSKALWYFVRITADACQALDQMTASNPKAMRPLARKMLTWPMPRSRYKRNCPPESCLAEMQLGEDVPIAQSAAAKWETRGAATQYAVALYGHLERIRADGDITVGGKPAKKWLPPFTRKTAPLWWHMARGFLLASYPQPERVAELAALVTAPTKRTTPGRIRAAILALLKNRLFSLADTPHAAHALHFCECGNPASRKDGSDWICERCYALQA